MVCICQLRSPQSSTLMSWHQYNMKKSARSRSHIVSAAQAYIYISDRCTWWNTLTQGTWNSMKWPQALKYRLWVMDMNYANIAFPTPKWIMPERGFAHFSCTLHIYIISHACVFELAGDEVVKWSRTSFVLSRKWIIIDAIVVLLHHAFIWNPGQRLRVFKEMFMLKKIYHV